MKKIGTYNLASGKSSTINNLAQILSKKKKLLKIIKKKERIEEVGNLRISINKAIKLGWKPKISLKNGLKKTVYFYEKYKKFL